MSIYQKKSRWKVYIALSGIAIVILSLAYTTYISREIASEERIKAENWAKAISVLSRMDVPDSAFVDISVEYIFDIIQSNKNIPAIITNEVGDVDGYSAYYAEMENINLDKEIAKMRATGFDSVKVEAKPYYTSYVHYKSSRLLILLQYFPYFQLALVALFIGISYWLFNWARTSEQNQVWVGLAKETAHQLGTPITAIVAWIELLKMKSDDDEELKDITEELEKDVKRLEQITERFSKIGAIPELKPQNVLTVIEKNMAYMKRRAPRRVMFEYPASEPPIIADFNSSLFDWVLENLLRNALDAMSREGTITAAVTDTKEFVIIDISDTGKGIPSSSFKTVFEPGFSTKKRGWGLGLSLTKRIVKNYHNGKIFVKSSEIGKGTTFRIQLPKG